MTGGPMIFLLLPAVCMLHYASAAPAYPNASVALATIPELSMLYAAANSINLTNDATFNGRGNWEATMFVPTNAAFTRMLQKKGIPFSKWLANSTEVKATLLHHIVSGYQIKSPAQWLYDTQILATLQTRVNGRSKLVVVKSGTNLAMNGDLSLAPFTAKKKPIGVGARVTFIEVDEVLLANTTSPPVLPLPDTKFTSLADAISKIPGLETFWRVLKGNLPLLTLLSNPNLNATVFAPNEAGLPGALAARNTTPEAFLSNATYLSRVMPYHVVPNVTTNALDFKNNRILTTLLLGHTIKIELYNGHVVPAGELTKGKIVYNLPRSLYIMDVRRGTMDVVAGKGALHVIDGWDLPKV